MRSSVTTLLAFRAAAIACLISAAAAYTSPPRWGQAHALVNDVLFVHGGKTDEYNAWGNTGFSAPSNNDLLYLSLSNAFDPADPNWDYVGGASNSCATQGPAVAWHTLSAFSTKDLLLFGGVPADTSSLNSADSAALLNVYDRTHPAWNCAAQSWAAEPVRRVYHAAASFGGYVYVVGGTRADGSGNAFADVVRFDPTKPEFALLDLQGGPGAIWGHAAVVMPSGYMLVLGGVLGGALVPFTSIWMLDLNNLGGGWSMASVADGNVPTPRRGFAATPIDDHRVLIHGGADAVEQTVYSDGWILDTSKNPMEWSRVDALTTLGGRRDHFAVHYGNSVVFGFGFGANGPIKDVSLSIFDIPSGSFTTGYTPPATPTFASTLPGPSSTVTLSNPNESGTATLTDTATGTNTAGSGSSGTGTNGHGSGTTGGGASSTSGSGHGGGNGDGNGGSGGGGGDGNGGTVADGDSKKSHTIAITLALLFGILGLIVGFAIVSFCLRRRREREQERFFLLGGDEFDDDPVLVEEGQFPTAGVADSASAMAAAGLREKSPRGASPSSGASTTPWSRFIAFLGLGAAGTAAARHRHRRRDMLADEDASQYEFGYNPYYDAPRRQPSAGSGSARPTLTKLVYGSLASLRSVGDAMFGTAAATAGAGRSTRSARSARSREPSARREALREKDEEDPFADRAPLVVAGVVEGKPQRPRGGRQLSSTSSRWSYTDPFADRALLHDDIDEEPRLSFEEAEHPTSQKFMPGGVAVTPLSPVLEQASQPDTGSNPSGSVSSHELARTWLSHDSSAASPHSAHRPGSILDVAHPPPAAPMKRSDSWWRRFASSSFLDRRASPREAPAEPHPPARGALVFRDPNPVPRLVTIAEGPSTHTTPDSPHDVGAGAVVGRRGSRRAGPYGTGSHRKSASSLQTTRTADSALIERAAGGDMVVVQRDGTGASSVHSPEPSAGSAAVSFVASPDVGAAPWRPPPPPKPRAPMRRPLSVVMSSGSHENDAASFTSAAESHASSSAPSTAPPLSISTTASAAAVVGHTRTRTPSPTTPGGAPPRSAGAGSLPGSPMTPGGVAARVRAFEQQATRTPLSPPPPHERSTRAREVRTGKGARPAVNYGLVPKPELYVANPGPDREDSGDSGLLR